MSCIIKLKPRFIIRDGSSYFDGYDQISGPTLTDKDEYEFILVQPRSIWLQLFWWTVVMVSAIALFTL